MYRHGLGDCFLLRFPKTGGGFAHVVIDSGVLKGTADASQKMTEVAQNIEAETEGKIDVLVTTHEHWDHVSGFKQAREVWDRIEIAHVWQAWTENPKDKLANKIRGDRAAKSEEVVQKFDKLREENSQSLLLDGIRTERVSGLFGFLGAASTKELGGTQEAMQYISGRGKPVYHMPGDIAKVPDVAAVNVFVLGPPHDETQIKKSDPRKKNSEVYEAEGGAQAFAVSDEGGIVVDDFAPFAPNVGIPVAKDYNAQFRSQFGSEDRDAWRRLRLDGMAELESLALMLDGDTNNTSLALAFELGKGGPVLLFPADAQVGNWMSWGAVKWKGSTVTMDDLFARTVLYKVGHHGSHNATMKDQGLEKMKNRDLIALVPVNLKMAAKKKWKMPIEPLKNRLMERTRGRVILADDETPIPKSEDLKQLTATERKKFEQMVVSTPLFHDVFIRL